MKRVGGLCAQICTPEALMAAWRAAQQEKRHTYGFHDFTRRLGPNMFRLARTLQDGTYRPAPCKRFVIRDRAKPRMIEAPAFRDLVVQHAVYAVLTPIVERKFIATSFACRTGRGTHQAADWLQDAMRQAAPDAWLLHVDVRKFFYRIDRTVLQARYTRWIKDARFVALIMMFAQRPEPEGVPIGNLLSQVAANVTLNSLDHLCKRDLGLRDYGRYMDDAIMIVDDRAHGEATLQAIAEHLGSLRLEISHYRLQPIGRGANFVGFRTWRAARFIRKSCLRDFRRDVQRGRIESAVSRLGHACKTHSFSHMMTYTKDTNHDLYRRLPQALHRAYRHHARCAGQCA
jgi:retron-type reverse transcriptase